MDISNSLDPWLPAWLCLVISDIVVIAVISTVILDTNLFCISKHIDVNKKRVLQVSIQSTWSHPGSDVYRIAAAQWCVSTCFATHLPEYKGLCWCFGGFGVDLELIISLCWMKKNPAVKICANRGWRYDAIAGFVYCDWLAAKAMLRKLVASKMHKHKYQIRPNHEVIPKLCKLCMPHA